MCMLTDNDRILLTVSGGVDSMVMLELFAHSSFAFGIAHCNFQLRGSDSDADEQLVRETAGRLAVPFHNIRFETEKHAKKRHISIEMAARELRYGWFKELAEIHGYTRIATAHHREDAEETFILNLSRGCGIKGLHGIPPVSGNIIRPMRHLSKKTLKTFAEKHGIIYREDTSNNEDICRRNIVRHHVLPALRRLHPHFDTNMDKSMRILHAQEEIYFHHIREVAARLLQPDGYGYSISMCDVTGLPFPETYLYEILHPYGFNEQQIGNLFDAGTGSKGRHWVSRSHQLWRHGDRLILQPLQNEPPTKYLILQTEDGIRTDCPFLQFQTGINDGICPHDPKTASLDMGMLSFPLQIRYWQPGDRFVPLGMKGTKKLSDFFTSLKMDIAQKGRTPLLCNGNGDILWVVGHRIDNRYRITDKTVRMLTIHFIP